MLMHPVAWSGGEGDHIFPGAEVWVYDAAAKVRTRRLALQGLGAAVFVTADDRPLMLVSGIDPDSLQSESIVPSISTLEVYDAATGEYLRQLTDMGFTINFEAAPGSGRSR